MPDRASYAVIDPRPDATHFTISDLSAEFGITARALRLYEDEGLIAPERRGTARVYSHRDRARLERGRVPSLTGAVDVPFALHLQVRVQRPVADAMKQVLPARHHAVHGLAGEVDRRDLRHAQLEPRHDGAGERVVESMRRAVDGVALRHARKRARRRPR